MCGRELWGSMRIRTRSVLFFVVGLLVAARAGADALTTDRGEESHGSAVVLHAVSASADADAETGRYKVDGSGNCYWDPNDSGPDQCYPNQGRYKVNGAGQCYWEPNDSGPNQCDPATPVPSVPPPNLPPAPEYDENSQPEVVLPQGLGAPAAPPVPSCAAITVPGNAGYIAAQMAPGSGVVAWGAYMYRAWENYGVWITYEFVNGQHRNTKRQFYPPHGSQPIASGSIFTLVVAHWYPKLALRWIWTPEFGYMPMVTWIPALAQGTLACMAP